jgi:hypothetical protein
MTTASMLPEAILMTDSIFDYSTMVEYYTARALTNQGDALRAMAGIIRRFTKVMKCRFFEGLPTALFDIFLLFRGNLLRRRPSFPSYSWTGWKGAVDFKSNGIHDEANDWLRYRTWIVWYKRSVSGYTSLVWDPDANESFQAKDLSVYGYRERHPFSSRRTVPRHLQTTRTAPTQDVTFHRPVPDYPMLQFWTITGFYSISGIDVFNGTGFLVDRSGIRCGMLWLDNFEESTFFEVGPFEVMLLSESNSVWYSEYSDSKYFEGLTREHYPKGDNEQWGFYSVLILEWLDGIAERRGFGSLFQGAIDKCLSPGPVWKEIFLA